MLRNRTNLLRQRLLASLAFLLLLPVLGACSSLPFLSTPVPTGLPSALPPTTVPTPLPDPQLVAREYLSAWQEGDTLRMYSWLTSISQELVTYEDFAAIYENIAGVITLRDVSFEILATFAQGRTAEVSYQIDLDTILVGQISRETVMELSLENGLWRIKWDRSLILPELRGNNTVAIELKTPSRGDIYDRNGKVIVAGDTNAVSVGLIAGGIDPAQQDNLFYSLWLLTGIEPAEIAEKLAEAREGWYVPLAEVPAALVQAQFETLEAYDGLVLEPFTSRYYFNGGIAPQAVGYVSLIQPEEADEYQRLGYRADERIGRSGLEKWGETYLAGTRGGTLYVVSPEGKRITLLAETDAKPAGAIYTTIDRALQVQLQQAVQGFTGAIVVLERDTGRILAMVSSPGYDPNLFEPSNYNSDFLLSGLLNDPSTPLLNRATQGQYPLGSVFKIITMAAALESGQYAPSSPYYCGSYFTEIPGISRADWTVSYQAPASGMLDLREGLMRSCNPWFWHIGLSFFNQGLDTQVSDMARIFGLGQATGLDQLVEAVGGIPAPINQIDAINLAIGQGDTLVTPLQVARFIAAIGNGGDMIRPQIVDRVVSANEEVLYEFQVESDGELDVQPETLTAIRQGLDWVVNKTRGTAYFRFRNLDVPVAGKTGTAEAPPGDPHAWFAGYTYAENEEKPDIAIAVIMEHAGEGSQVGAPLFRRAVELYFFGQALTPLPWEDTLPAAPPSGNSP